MADLWQTIWRAYCMARQGDTAAQQRALQMVRRALERYEQQAGQSAS